MKNSSNRKNALFTSRFEGAASALIAASTLFGAGSAHAETSVWADTSVNARISNNPYLLTGTNNDSASSTVSLAPGVSFNDGTTTVSVTGQVQHTEFFKRYGSTDSYSVNGSLNQRFNAKTGFRANLGYDSSVVGANDLLSSLNNGIPGGGIPGGGIPGGGNPGGGVLPPLPGDITLNGLRQRRTSFNGGLGLDYTASARDRWNIGSSFSISQYPTGSVASEYGYAAASLGYNRTLNGRTSIGFDVSVSQTDYRRTALGDATTVSPQLRFTTKLDGGWSLSVSAGASRSSIREVVGRSNQTSLSGSVNLCQSSQSGAFCLFGSSAVQPTSFGGVRPQTSVGASYNARLDGRSSIGATVNYARSSQSSVGAGRSVDYGNASITYSHRITAKLQGYFTAGYADSFRDTISRRANADLTVGISYTFGERR